MFYKNIFLTSPKLYLTFLKLTLLDKPYYVVDAAYEGHTAPCGSLGMIMRGVEVDNSIAIYASPDYIHTKWNISHEKPMFDYEPSAGCIPTVIIQNVYLIEFNF